MNKKIRYSIIIFGMIAFAVSAPLIIFFLRGINYDTKNHTYKETGILSIKTDPKNSQIYLSGIEKGTSPATLRFLTPDEYQVQIQKPDYQSWSKHITVKAGKVTYASSDPGNPVVLFLEHPNNATVVDKIAAGLEIKNNIYAITNTQLISTEPTGNLNSLNIESKTPLEKIISFPENPETIALYGQNKWQLFQKSTNQLKPLPKLSANTNLTVTKRGDIFALDGQTLYQINDKQQLEKITDNTLAFSTTGDQGYFIKSTPEGQSLTTSRLTGSTQNTQLLTNQIPKAGHYQLIITKNKEIFLIADTTLYKINSNPEAIDQNILWYRYDDQTDTLLIQTATELSYYDWQNSKLTLITRSTSTVADAVVRKDLGYIFLLENNTLTALELDNRDIQNRFSLYQGINLKNLSIDSTGKHAYLQDNTRLLDITIR